MEILFLYNVPLIASLLCKIDHNILGLKIIQKEQDNNCIQHEKNNM